jgi:hypothetical protein
MRAHVELLNGGPAAVTVCVGCELYQDHDRTEDAQDAARAHNRTAHPIPEHTLDTTEEQP